MFNCVGTPEANPSSSTKKLDMALKAPIQFNGEAENNWVN